MEKKQNTNRQPVELNRTSLYLGLLLIAVLGILLARGLIRMFAEGRIPLWIVATVAGMGVIAVVGVFFYGAYAGVGSGM